MVVVVVLLSQLKSVMYKLVLFNFEIGYNVGRNLSFVENEGSDPELRPKKWL